MMPQLVKALAAQIFGLPEVKIVNRDSEVMRAILMENAELRRRLELPPISSIQCTDGHMSRITYDLPPRMWASRIN